MVRRFERMDFKVEGDWFFNLIMGLILTV